MRTSALLRCVCIVGLTALSAYAEVRPISEAERAAAQVAAAYLSRGPEAVYEQLATTSPLRKFSHQQALEEIEVRLGPPAGSRWEMQTVVPSLQDRIAAFTVAYPSGLDDHIFFDLTKESGQFKISDLRMLAMRSTRPQMFPPRAAAAPQAKESGVVASAAIAGVLAIAMSLVAVLFLRGRAAVQKILLLLAAISGGAATYFVATGRQFIVVAEASATKSAAPPSEQLSSLLPLRRAMASGATDVGTLFAHASRSDATAEVARLWKAQWDLLQMRTDAVKQALAAFPSPSQVPLAELLRARLALTENDDGGAMLAYEQATNLGPGRDALWLERAQALAAAGFPDQVSGFLRRMTEIGSRDAIVYYAQAMDAAASNRFEECEAELKRAWNLLPVERGDLVSSDVLYWLMRRRGPGFINLSTPDEATFASPAISTRAITLPAAAVPRVSGDFLEVAIGDQELLVPGGAALAPSGSAVVDAGTWAREKEERALKESAELTAAAATVGAYTQPVLRRRIESSAAALVHRNRWKEVVDLTRGISPTSQFVPMDLFFDRATALRRLDRGAEARQLVHEVAASPVLERNKDARELVGVAEQLAGFDDYDLAIRMYGRAKAARSELPIDSRVAQLEMNKRLATSYGVYESAHFTIHYPPEVTAATAIAVGKVLEGELQRLQKWVPVPNFKKVVVNIVWWKDFKEIYTGTDDILGFYHGSITLPLAGIIDLEPEIVAIITHELTHAMVAQATNDQAPHWFQEAIAQRYMPIPMVPNAFNMYDDDKLLALRVLDPVLEGSGDPDMMGEAYIVSQTLLRYLEAKYGEGASGRLIQSFAAGATTEEAMQALSTQSIAALDVDFRTWGRAEKRVFENPAAPTYQLTAEDTIQRAEPNAPKQKLQGGTLHPYKTP